MTNEKIKFDLEERTTQYSKKILLFCRDLKINEINRSTISQLIRACTSIGANYCEADDAESRKDFVHKIKICKKEARETRYWLDLLLTLQPEKNEDIKQLSDEAKELNLIFNAIVNSTNRNSY